MAYDGIVTRAVVRELQNNILLGKIEKVYQPEADDLVFHIHTKNGNRKLFASAGWAHFRCQANGFGTYHRDLTRNPK